MTGAQGPVTRWKSVTQFTQCFTSMWEGRVEMTEVRFPPWSLGVLSCPQLYRLKHSEPRSGFSLHARPRRGRRTAQPELTESTLVK